LDGVPWIWQPDNVQTCVLQRTFVVPQRGRLSAAVFGGTTTGNFSVSLNGIELGRVPGRVNPPAIDCLSELRTGENSLSLDAATARMRPAPGAVRARL